MDTVVESLHQRFLCNGTLYADLALLDPTNFDQITTNTSDLPQTALQEISKCLLKFDSTATVTKLQCELSSLAEQWPRLKRSAFDEYTIRTTEDVPEEDDGVEIVNKSCSSCKNCPVLLPYYLSIQPIDQRVPHFGTYKFLLTLSVTQVACGRSFSTLKFIKSRLRSSLTQQHLEAFMLMASERDVLMALDSDQIIDGIAERSEQLRKLLT